MVKAALGAGHYQGTPGKRCMRSIDSNETREWLLNDRIVDYIEDMLKDYEGIEVLRLADTLGKKDISLGERTDKANAWGADILISNHHNAGINGGRGGGITVYRHPVTPQATKDYQKGIYDKIIKYTGLKGNRSQPLGVADHHMTRESDMPALLIENGFMDSKTDVPVILTAAFALNSARAQVEFLVEEFKLKKKPKPQSTLYKVQIGAFSSKDNAEKLAKQAKLKGFETYIEIQE